MSNAILRVFRAALVLTGLLALTLPASGQAPLAPAPAPSAPTGLRLFPDTPRGHFGDVLTANAFPETQRRQLFIVDFPRAVAGAEIEAAIVSVRSAGGLEQQVYAASARVDSEGRLPLEVRLPRDWPVGFYEVRLSAAKKAIGALPYRVLATAPRVTPIKAAAAITIVLYDANDKPTTISAPKSSDRHLYFTVQTTGANTNGVSVAWSLRALATSAGNNIAVGAFVTDNLPIENTRLAFDMELPRDWPTGKYGVEVKIDGQPLAELTFDIKP